MQLRDQYLWYAKHLDQLIEAGGKVANVSESTSFELGALSSQYLTWSNLEAIAHREVEKAEERLKKILIPQSKALLRAKLSKLESKVPSEARLDSDVLNDPSVSEGARQLVDLKFIESLFKNVRLALLEKREALTSINAKECVELKSYSNAK